MIDVAADRLGTHVEFWLTTAARAIAITLGLVLATTSNQFADVWPTALALVGVALVAGAASRQPSMRLRRVAVLAEAVAAPLIVLHQPETSGVFLPYFYASALSAAFVGFSFVAVTTVVVFASSAVAVLLLGGLPASQLSNLLLWLAQVAGVGMLSVSLRHFHSPSTSTDTDVATARAILTDLRTVSRRLPGSLDPGVVTEQILQHVQRVVPLEGGAVLVGSDALDAVDEAAMNGSSWEDATGAMLADGVSSSGRADDDWPGSTPSDHGERSLILPLEVRGRLVGAVVGTLSSQPAGRPASPDELAAEAGALATLAARLEIALLFEEVRNDATGDERRRLAREIHDGIAQDLVYIGYALEDIGHESSDVHTTTSLQQLRAQVTQLVSDLRLSIYDLRHDVGPSRSLGVALTEHLRHVSTTASLTIHLSLVESGGRLTISQETEILRIAQEAVSNVRRHAQARNLWVTCQVDERVGYLQVRDDGVGIASARTPGGFGVTGMRERAARIGAELSAIEHPAGGTVVEVQLDRIRAEASPAAAPSHSSLTYDQPVEAAS